MKANELRLGNWFVWGGQPFRVSVLAEGAVGFTKKNLQRLTTDISKVTPIPLTEEWLVKGGFAEVFKHLNHGTLKSFELQLSNDSIIVVQFRPEAEGLLWLSITDCDYDGCILTSIDKVHQLQNLYFALTNEELTFTI